jgi:hypothetical protein
MAFIKQVWPWKEEKSRNGVHDRPLKACLCDQDLKRLSNGMNKIFRQDRVTPVYTPSRGR